MKGFCLKIIAVSLFLSIVTSTVIINKPYKNLKILNSWKTIIKDRNLVQCYIAKEFQNSDKNCPKSKLEDDKARKLRQMLRNASNCPACRRTQYKDQIIKCRQVISGMFKEFLKYEMTSNREKEVYFDLVTSFARYVLLLKEFQQNGRIPTDPKTNIQNFIDDQVFDMKRKGSGIISGHTIHVTQPDGSVVQAAAKTVHRTGASVVIPSSVVQPVDTKAVLDDKAKHLDKMAQTMIDKYDNPPLRKKMHAQGKLIKVPRRRRRRKIGFNKYSFRYGDIDQKINRIKKTNRARYHPVAKHEQQDSGSEVRGGQGKVNEQADRASANTSEASTSQANTSSDSQKGNSEKSGSSTHSKSNSSVSSSKTSKNSSQESGESKSSKSQNSSQKSTSKDASSKSESGIG